VRTYPRVLWLDQGQVRADGNGPDVCAAYEAHVHQLIAEAAHPAEAPHPAEAAQLAEGARATETARPTQGAAPHHG
jgi:ABC transporter related